MLMLIFQKFSYFQAELFLEFVKQIARIIIYERVVNKTTLDYRC